MSLRVWLPLTKDLRNQGLDNVAVINNGATFNSEGKLGGCYSFPASGGHLKIPADVMSNFVASNGCSLAFWIKINAWNSGWETYFQAGTGGNPRSNYIFGILRNNTNSTICFTIGDGSSSSSNSYLTSNWETGVWFHMTFVYETGKCKIYKNGLLDKEYSTSRVPDFSKITKITVGKCNNETSYQVNCNLNDLRIYDNALSETEVKELSQGLVLHYLLSDRYIESTTNLVTTQDGLSNACYNGANGKYGYGTNTDMYKTVGTFKNRESTKVYMGTDGLRAYPYIYFDSFNAAGEKIQTLSFDYFPIVQDKIIPYSYNGAYNFSYTTDKTSGSATNVRQIIIPVDVGRWNHITITAQKTDTTNTTRGIGYIRIGAAAHMSDTSNYWLFGNVQVEEKDHATGYAGVGGIRNSTTVYDTSGFCNNGTISGELTISDDSPKYNVSTYMSKESLITHPCPVFNGNDQEWTCSMWVKLDNISQTQQCINNFNVGNYIVYGSNTYPILYLNWGTNDYYNYGNKAVVANTWTHIAFVFKNSNATKLIYINGIEQTNKNGPNKTSTPVGIPDIVIVGTNLAGYISDYRIYATALSADDIKTLYNSNKL